MEELDSDVERFSAPVDSMVLLIYQLASNDYGVPISASGKSAWSLPKQSIDRTVCWGFVGQPC